MFLARQLMVWALPALAPAAWAQQGGDYQAQILYAYQTEDANSLVNLVQDLTTQVKADGSDPALRYHLAHAQYRRGLLAGTTRAREAETAFADCVDQLKPLLSQDVKSVEALILQSACYAGLADLRKLESVLLRARSDERLKTALKLAPRNPRAVFLSAMNGLDKRNPAPPSGSMRSRSCSLPCNCSTRPRPRASTLPVGDMPRRTWLLDGSCRRAAINWGPATGSRNP